MGDDSECRTGSSAEPKSFIRFYPTVSSTLNLLVVNHLLSTFWADISLRVQETSLSPLALSLRIIPLLCSTTIPTLQLCSPFCQLRCLRQQNQDSGCRVYNMLVFPVPKMSTFCPQYKVALIILATVL